MRVLLIEDDSAIANLYKIKLESNYYMVSLATNGLDGLKQAEHSTPDLILLDLKMPIMSGEKFLEKFRRQVKFKDIPIVVLTNISREEAPKTLWHYGISGYFVKAHNTPKDLIDLIKMLGGGN